MIIQLFEIKNGKLNFYLVLIIITQEVLKRYINISTIGAQHVLTFGHLEDESSLKIFRHVSNRKALEIIKKIK